MREIKRTALTGAKTKFQAVRESHHLTSKLFQSREFIQQTSWYARLRDVLLELYHTRSEATFQLDQV